MQRIYEIFLSSINLKYRDIRLLAFPALNVFEKIVCFVIGYLIVRLGYKLLVSGIKGEFKFTSEYKGLKGGLISSSPGLLFVLLGTILIGYALFVSKPFDYTEKGVIVKNIRDTIKTTPAIKPQTTDSVIIRTIHSNPTIARDTVKFERSFKDTTKKP